MRRQVLLPPSARKFLTLVRESARTRNLTPYKVCGISKATFYRWQAATTPIPIKKAIAVAQRQGINENEFLGRESITEVLLSEKRDELIKHRLLHERYTMDKDRDGQTESVFGVARVIQSKLVLSGHNVLLLCEQTQEISRTRLSVSSPTSPQVLTITVFSEGPEIFCVLEDDKETPLVGFNVTGKNIRKLLKTLHSVFGTKSKDFSLDTMAKNMITDLR